MNDLPNDIREAVARFQALVTIGLEPAGQRPPEGSDVLRFSSVAETVQVLEAGVAWVTYFVARVAEMMEEDPQEMWADLCAQSQGAAW